MPRFLIMAKAPVPGTIKTRLRLPPETAAGLQAAFIRDTVEKVISLGPVTVAVTPPDLLSLVEPLLPKAARLLEQAEGDLGERMFSATLKLFEEEPGPVLILGTDAPTLPPAGIRQAARALETGYGASIAGSDDGGYVLLGLEEPYEGLFRSIYWSTGSVYRETVEKARALNISIHEGEPHYDVDTPEDLARLEGELEGDPRLAPYTAEFLRSLRRR